MARTKYKYRLGILQDVDPKEKVLASNWSAATALEALRSLVIGHPYNYPVIKLSNPESDRPTGKDWARAGDLIKIYHSHALCITRTKVVIAKDKT